MDASELVASSVPYEDSPTATKKKSDPHEKGPLASNAANESARSEIREYLDTSQQRRRVLPRAALVGICAGIIALLFRAALTGAGALRNTILAWAHNRPTWGWVLPVLLTPVGAGIAAAITRRYAPEASGSGIPHLEAVLRRFRELEWKRVLPLKFFGGILAIGSGLALGREGPSVQMGGALGDAFSRWLKVSERERLTLISAGAGAGLAAAFNAPFAGVIFVLEELRGDFQPIVFGAAFVAAITADLIVRISSGPFPIFRVPNYPAPPLASLPVFILLGVVAGLFGVLFNRSLLATLEGYGRLSARLMLPAVALTGLIVGLVGWFFPLLLGSGDSLVEATLKGDVLLTAVPLLFVVRFFVTMISYGTGVPGGIFAPLLGLGALIGLGIGQLAHSLLPGAVPIPAVLAVVGMAAYFTAIVRAPLTGIMLIVEMTGSYALMLFLLISCFFAYAVAEYLQELPIYEALLERDLKRGGEAHALKKPVIVELTIEPHSLFDGCEIRSLGLPAGCIIIRCTDGRREWVPKANTRLEAHMRIAVVVAPEAAGALDKLRQGCQASND